MAFLEVRQIRKEFPGVVALDGVDLSVELGKVHVLAGENGAGKSTLVKILTGVDAPTRGAIRIDGKDARAQRELFDLIAYVPQELNLFPHMTVAENLFMPFGKTGMGRAVIDRKGIARAAEESIARFGVHARPEQLVKDLPVSEQQLLQIARAFVRETLKVLILDEPTAALTDRETARLFEVVRTLRATGHAVIFISHKLEEMFALGDEVTVLRNGEKVGHAPMADIDEAGLIRMMSGKDIKLDATFRPEGAPGEVLLEVEGLSGAGYQDASFQLRAGEVLGFAGLVGAGRSELMQGLFGFTRPKAGAVRLRGTPLRPGSTGAAVEAGMLYLSESRKEHGILPLLSVRENVAISVLPDLVRAGLISDGRERRLVAEVIERYQIKTSSAAKKIMYLSGGNQQKVIIGRAMACRPRVLIFDEPTKGIDVKTKVDIYAIMKGLAEQGMGIVLVSSEMNELLKCANRIVTMYHGRIVGEFVTERTNQHELVEAIIGARSPGHELGSKHPGGGAARP